MTRPLSPVKPGQKIAVDALNAEEVVVFFRNIIVALAQKFPNERFDLAEAELVRAQNSAGRFRMTIQPSPCGNYIENLQIEVRKPDGKE